MSDTKLIDLLRKVPGDARASYKHGNGFCNVAYGYLFHKSADALEQAQVRREMLADDREHLTITNEFQSDKYPWCPAGFIPIKITDPLAMDLLSEYADRRKKIDAEFSRDLNDALLAADYE